MKKKEFKDSVLTPKQYKEMKNQESQKKRTKKKK
jgi:hypothetical protein